MLGGGVGRSLSVSVISVLLETSDSVHIGCGSLFCLFSYFRRLGHIGHIPRGRGASARAARPGTPMGDANRRVSDTAWLQCMPGHTRTGAEST